MHVCVCAGPSPHTILFKVVMSEYLYLVVYNSAFESMLHRLILRFDVIPQFLQYLLILENLNCSATLCF